uniref:DNA-binding protein n=1 Tax=Marinitoga okinawensis TaxID=389480 RepID=A0A9C7GWE7_9BACT|nr:DNA-binding protein [Marinitoga okinawensis]
MSDYALKIFENEELGNVRVIMKDNEPWFVGKDVTNILGYKNTKDILIKHVDVEDKQVLQRSQNATLEIPNRGLTAINEYGLYSLILKSKLSTDKKFKH